MISRASFGFFSLSLLFISNGVANAASIDVGSHLLQPDMANQSVVISVASEVGDSLVRGMNLRAQIGDGNGPEDEPVFQGMLGTFEGLGLAGSIWDGLASGSTLSGNGLPRTGFGSLGSADLTSDNPAENVAADGTLLTLLIDTTGFSTPGSFDLSLAGTALGDTTLIAADGSAFSPLSLTNGSITIVEPVSGDFNGNGVLDPEDIDMLAEAIRQMSTDVKYDLNEDGQVNFDDHTQWVVDPAFAGTYVGDSNLDDEFNSSDLVSVFGAGEYEDGDPLNSTWTEGDWNGDGDFGTDDLVAAFQDGGFELGPRLPASAVPEPTSSALLLLGGILWLATRRFSA